MTTLEDQLKKIIGGGFGAEGWDALEEGGSQEDQLLTYEQQLKQYQHAETLVKGISGDALAILHDLCFLPSTWKVDELGLINGIGYGIFREGQISLYRYIEQCQRIVEQGPPDAPESLTEENQSS